MHLFVDKGSGKNAILENLIKSTTLENPHWDFSILIAGLILALFLYNKKVVIYKTEFKQAKNNRIQ